MKHNLFSRRGIVAIAVFFSFANMATAQSAFTVGIGTASCKDYLEIARDKNEGGRLIVVSWMQGYMSGLNLARTLPTSERKAIDIPDHDVLLAHLLLFCKQKPSESVASGTVKLYQSLPGTTK
jgi:HdeA/HdeB family